MYRCKDLINDNQHGFLPDRSCETQLIPFYNDLAISLNECSRTDVIYFDFAKAFDSVNHDIILHKLKHQFGINGKLLKFFVAYLKDREQQVVVGGEFSQSQQVLSGVPQGSILGPTLFVLFINDISNSIDSNSKIKLYADDTKLYRKISTPNDCLILQNDINILNNWSVENKMKFHPRKCKVLTVTMKRSPTLYVYKLGDTPIQLVNTEKDLGVNFHSSLTWTDHCNYLYSKASRMLGLARRTCHFINNVRRKRTIYLALVRSQFEHCSTVWRPGFVTTKNKLENIQRKAVRWILNKYNCVGMSPTQYYRMCKELNLLSLDLRLEYNDLKMLYKIIYNMSVIKLPSYISWYSGTRLRSSHMDSYCLISSIQPRIAKKYNTRINNRDAHTDNDSPDQTATSFSKFSNNYFYRAICSWNRLPLEVRLADKPSTFNRLLEAHLWEVFYQNSCTDEGLEHEQGEVAEEGGPVGGAVGGAAHGVEG